MSAESDLYAALKASAPLQAIVGVRIYADRMPEDVSYPAVVFQRAGTQPIQSISGQTFGAFVTFNVTAWAEKRETADDAASAIEAVARSAGHEINNREAGFDPEMDLFASTVTFTALAT